MNRQSVLVSRAQTSRWGQAPNVTLPEVTVILIKMHHVIILSDAFLGLTKFGGLFSRSTSYFPCSSSKWCISILLLVAHTSSERSRIFLPPLISHRIRNTSQVASFCWPGRRYCCCCCSGCCCYKRSSNTLKSILSFRLLRAFSLGLVYDGQKNPPAFGDLISTKSKLVPVSFSGPHEYWCQIPKLSHSGGGYGFYPLFFFCSCHLSWKTFHETFLFIPNAPHEVTHIYFLFSCLYQVHLCFPLFRVL